MIDYNLEEKPTEVTVIEGFPSFGLVSTISIEFLMDHLDFRKIGEFVYDELRPTVAIHEGEMVHPMSILYSDEHDLVMLHTTMNVSEIEWEMAETILDLAHELKAEEIITLEGVPVDQEGDVAFTYENEEMVEAGAEPLEESILVGITAALILRSDDITPLFAGAHSQLPDGEAAANLIRVLDNYLGLDVDPEPLIEKATQFENKLQKIMQQSQEAQEEADSRRLNYLG